MDISRDFREKSIYVPKWEKSLRFIQLKIENKFILYRRIFQKNSGIDKDMMKLKTLKGNMMESGVLL